MTSAWSSSNRGERTGAQQAIGSATAVLVPTGGTISKFVEEEH
jgi:hypothetical protein